MQVLAINNETSDLVPLTTDTTGLAGKCISPQMLLSLSTMSALYLKVKST